MINPTDPITWLLHIEDSTLSADIVNLGDGAGLTRLGLTTKDDSDKLPATFWTITIGRDSAIQLAKQAYRRAYWVPLGLAQIQMPLAASILSCAVDCGKGTAAKLLSRISHTVTNPNDLLNAFIQEWSNHYRAIAIERPVDAKFLDGWLARAAAIFPELPR